MQFTSLINWFAFWKIKYSVPCYEVWICLKNFCTFIRILLFQLPDSLYCCYLFFKKIKSVAYMLLNSCIFSKWHETIVVYVHIHKEHTYTFIYIHNYIYIYNLYILNIMDIYILNIIKSVFFLVSWMYILIFYEKKGFFF